MKEKSPREQSAAHQQTALLINALNGAVAGSGYWLNAAGFTEILSEGCSCQSVQLPRIGHAHRPKRLQDRTIYDVLRRKAAWRGNIATGTRRAVQLVQVGQVREPP